VKAQRQTEELPLVAGAANVAAHEQTPPTSLLACASSGEGEGDGEGDGGGFTAFLESAARESLVVTYWLDSIGQATPSPITVQFTGRRADVDGPLTPADRFIHYETAEVIPDTGPISVTARIRDIAPGAWNVSAQLVESPSTTHTRLTRGQRRRRKQEQEQQEQERAVAPVADQHVPVALARLWRRWAPSVGASQHEATALHTHIVSFAPTPGIIPMAWAVLVGLGMVAALTTQSFILAHENERFGPIWLVWLAILGVGAIGAKLWYIITYRNEHRWEGWCIQGFITGATLAAAVTLLALHIPAGTFLDAVAPGVLLGMAIGRVGCFFAGCCGGPPTTAWWGVWSSDQRIGARRVPTQLMESALALSLGIATLVAVVAHGPANGAFFVGGLAAYTLGRQGVLKLRAEPRKTRFGLPITVALTATICVAAIVYIVAFAR